jgi:hypothetical protein
VIKRITEVQHLKAFAGWRTIGEPHWLHVDHPPID